MEERRREYPSILNEIREIKESYEKLNHILIGNGEEGLIDKVRSNSRSIAEIKDLKRWVIGNVVGFIAQVVIFAFIAGQAYQTIENMKIQMSEIKSVGDKNTGLIYQLYSPQQKKKILE